ncbi:GNAT family N-acetyltransferase [Hahella sp. CCB-MM4]|uniref:GNAT family N-acetyltransferase n=1 Tax=Hahella sp. (strain CCB-MM4) TaxID=1926491 RepID=UPI000B9BF9BC|nr:GNAT family N-acetyltransferase [Hahella sp. CCB-MM4]OZG70094.1 GNAT family N-acetyltransferase [Hahella sp. CCB-MM4]
MTSSNSRLTIRKAALDDVKLMADWAAAEGWNPGLFDAGVFYSADTDGFLIGELDQQPVSCISVVKYNDDFGFLGFYIVKPEFRGKGFGIQTWKAGLDYLSGCNIGLDGVVEQQDNYKTSGFTLAYRNIRYEGAGGGEVADMKDVVDLSDFPEEALSQYDRKFFPADRSTFLHHWLRQPNAHTAGLVRENRLCGYGVIRECRSGYKIGPLFADTPEIAERLFLVLKSHATEKDKIYLDIPAPNPAALALVEKYAMSPVFETARMYTKAAPEISVDRLYGVTSFELG